MSEVAGDIWVFQDKPIQELLICDIAINAIAINKFPLTEVRNSS